MKKLIGLAGKAGVGKDTAAIHIETTHHYNRYAFAMPIKWALSVMGFKQSEYDIDGIKDRVIPEFGVSYRKLAQTLGTEWGRAAHPDFWLLLAKRHYRNGLKPGQVGMVVSDVRFENEADWIRAAGGLMIHIDGPARREIAKDGNNHASEVGVERKQGDVIVTNYGDMFNLFQQLDNALEVFHAAR